MATTMRVAACLTLVAIRCLWGAPSSNLDAQATARASAVIRAAGTRSGLAVQFAPVDGRLAAALHERGFAVVHGLDSDPVAVKAARDVVRQLGCYGPVSFDLWDRPWLPYCDNMVNLVLMDETAARRIPREEVLRVLTPRGTMLIGQDNNWRTVTKPVPETIDEWTHFLHDASGNAVARDTVVAPPRHMQWEAGPTHGRSHEYTASTSTLVSSGGRIFYVADKAPVAALRQPAAWHIVARDAFNGLLLWERPVDRWFSSLCTWTGVPRDIQRRMVAVGDNVYVTLGYFGEVVALDAATGEVLRTFDGTAGTEEILWHRGILVLAMRQISDEQLARFKALEDMTATADPALVDRETRRPLFRAFRRGQTRAEPAVVALDADTGQRLWKRSGDSLGGLRPRSLRAAGDVVLYQGKQTTCIDLRTGGTRWTADTHPVLTMNENVVICSNHKTVTAVEVENGRTRWTQTPLLSQVREAFIISQSVWLGGFKPYDTGRKKYTGPVWGPHFATERSLATGNVTRHIETENPGHHHRCYENKATERYMLVGRRGTEFYDLQTGDITWHSWARGVCRYGVMPCNGMLYRPPHACGCYVTVKLNGFTALAGHRSPPPDASRDRTQRLEKGPAFGTVDGENGATTRNEWPTFRASAARNAGVSCRVEPDLTPAWQISAGPRLSALTCSRGKLYVAIKDEHRIAAFDAGSGTRTWTFTAGGRIDSPPTVYGDCIIFGCRDGFVYNLKAADGALVWRFRAAADGRSIVSRGQLESVSPLHGSVLVDDGVLTVTAGRSSFLDGGIDMYRIDPVTGELLSTTDIDGPSPASGKTPTQYGPNAMPGARSDILSADEHAIYLQDLVFTKNGERLDARTPHLFTLTGYLDESWTHRSYWIFGDKPSIATGCSGRAKTLIYARLLAFDKQNIYGYGRATVHWSNQLLDGPYQIYCRHRTAKEPSWRIDAPIDARTLILVDNILFVAGTAVVTRETDSPRKAEPNAELLALSAKTGSILSRHALPAPPTFNGIAAIPGNLFLSLQDGTLICLRNHETP